MIMGNHGVLVIGETVAETFMRLYYFERAARTYILALHTGKPLRVLSPEVAERTARQQEGDRAAEAAFLRGLRDVLDAEEPDYAD
jgi:ribulose-5-phosphate 4-epimerase/fuculose-1-phosphate aldolase